MNNQINKMDSDVDDDNEDEVCEQRHPFSPLHVPRYLRQAAPTLNLPWLASRKRHNCRMVWLGGWRV